MPRRQPLPRRALDTAVGVGIVILVPGAAALALHRVLLFPSLGPSVLMQAHSPEQPAARPYNIVVGHGLGLASAFLFVWLLGLAHAPSVFTVHDVSAARVWASALALACAAAGEVVLDAAHPPAASTTLLAALGSFRPTWTDACQVAAGVLMITAAGEGLRRYRLRARAAQR